MVSSPDFRVWDVFATAGLVTFVFHNKLAGLNEKVPEEFSFFMVLDLEAKSRIKRNERMLGAFIEWSNNLCKNTSYHMKRKFKPPKRQYFISAAAGGWCPETSVCLVACGTHTYVDSVQSLIFYFF